MQAFVLGVLMIPAAIMPGFAETLSALARLDPASSSISDRNGGLRVSLAISQPVPWRVRLMDAPPRLIVDVRDVDWTGAKALGQDVRGVNTLRAGVFRPGWSRLVLELSGPMTVTRAGMTTRDVGAAGVGARIDLILTASPQAEFAAAAARPDPPGWTVARPVSTPLQPSPRDGPAVVVLDPGHGGIDPGAENGKLHEADVVLSFARELKDVLQRDARFRVVLTRDDDIFVPLETRISIARGANAQAFISLHADALAEGTAVGATIYTLSGTGVDAAGEKLAERHDLDDILSGVDLTGQDDQVAQVLIDMARAETMPRVGRLAGRMVTAIKAADLEMQRRALRSGAFSVLKSPDIPSILVELGFLSSDRDLARLTDPEWRLRMAAAIRDGLVQWFDAEAALSAISRR